jgi:phenylalanyl-tRNA synthetase beta chain
VGIVERSQGFTEIMSSSFIGPAYYNKICLPEDSPLRNSIRILNPLGEETSIMRTTALPSMLETLSRNYRNHNLIAKLYELARVYFPTDREDGLAREEQVVSMGAYAPLMDFFVFKGYVETLFEAFAIEDVSYTAVKDDPSWHPGRTAAVSIKGKRIGTIGQIHPRVAKNYGMDVPVFAAQLDFAAILEAKPDTIVYEPLPKFPAVERDIAVVCDRSIPVAELEDCIRRGGKGLVREVKLFDIYTGKPIPAAEMVQYGAVHSVVPKDQLLDCAMGIAKEIAEMYPPSVWASKMVITEGEKEVQDVVDISDRMRIKGNRVLLADDPNKGEMIRAQLEHRKPVYDLSFFQNK